MATWQEVSPDDILSFWFPPGLAEADEELHFQSQLEDSYWYAETIRTSQGH